MYLGTDEEGAPRWQYAEWSAGATRMARDLGFDDEAALLHWADSHPALWGNLYGKHMFSGECAFGLPPPGRRLGVEDLAAHWHAVADRIADGAQRK